MTDGEPSETKRNLQTYDNNNPQANADIGIRKGRLTHNASLSEFWSLGSRVLARDNM